MPSGFENKSEIHDRTDLTSKNKMRSDTRAFRAFQGEFVLLAGLAAARYSKHMNDRSLDTLRKKLLFRAQRRGFKEVDLIFGTFAEKHLARLDAVQLARFEALLAVPDWQVWNWIAGHEPVPKEFDNDVFALLRSFRPAHGP
ncbi:MAG: succinate dehydrogenase assembly factor 2 [Alphaproteobacteria bacterium]